MLKERVLPADLFTVINKTILQDSERKVLMMLYQPIIGSDAISLYYSLWTYLDKLEIMSDTWTHHHLMTNLQMRLDFIIEAREKLEAVGLLKTYLKKGEMNQFIYELYSPLSVKEFFDNPLLSTVLYNNIGDIEYQRTIEYFKIPKIDLTSYEDITCKFQDVFESTDMTNFTQIVEDLKHTTKNKLEIMASINLEHIFSMIPEELLNIRSVTNETKEFLYRMSFIYGFTDDDMVNLLWDSFTDKRTIDKDKFKEKAVNYYKFEHNGSLPSLAYKMQPEYLRKKDLTTSLRDKKIFEFETTSPYDYLYSKQAGDKVSTNEIQILNYLLDTMKFTPGVTNVIIDYVLTKCNNKLVFNYVESVAGFFSRNKVKTVEEAMTLAEKDQASMNEKIVKKQSKKIEKKPDWLDKKFEVKEATEEEQKEMKDLISKVIR